MDSQMDQLKVRTIKSKPLSDTAYGFRSFKNFRLRILISFKNSFYSMNYKQKAADLNNVKSAAYAWFNVKFYRSSVSFDIEPFVLSNSIFRIMFST